MHTRSCSNLQFCLQSPCVTTGSLERFGFGEAHVQNHVARRRNYKDYWNTLNGLGLWRNPVYLAKKLELGDRVDGQRERITSLFSALPAELQVFNRIRSAYNTWCSVVDHYLGPDNKIHGLLSAD